MKKLFEIALTFVFASIVCAGVVNVASCKSMPVPIEPSYVETFTDGGDDDAPLSDLPDGALRFPDCAAACKTLRRLACSEAAKLDGGLSCYDICAKAETSSRSLNPKCVADAGTRDVVRACKTVRCIDP